MTIADSPYLENIGRIALVFALAAIAIWLGNRSVNGFVRVRSREGEDATPELLAVRRRYATAGGILKRILRWSALAVAGYFVLIELFGLQRFLALLAGAGVAGVIIGFGAQAVLKDVLAGLFFLVEGQFGVGDAVRLRVAGEDVYGVVEYFGLRTTRLRDFNGDTHYVSNGRVDTVERYQLGYLAFAADIQLPLEVASVGEALSSEDAEAFAERFPVMVAGVHAVRLLRGMPQVLRIEFSLPPGYGEMADLIAREIGALIHSRLSLAEGSFAEPTTIGPTTAAGLPTAGPPTAGLPSAAPVEAPPRGPAPPPVVYRLDRQIMERLRRGHLVD